MSSTMVGVIGGSGLYDIEGLQNPKWIRVETPWGEPSDDILTGKIDGARFAFLPRHGRGHMHSPTTVPYRANIDALKQVGVTDVISISACGSFREEFAPGHFLIVDQFIDRTFAREKSFFGEGCVGHVSMASPVCARLAKICQAAARDAGITTHFGGTYLAMEGPQFSTKAESLMYRNAWNCDVIGMTNMPEAKLAREAELCYATVAMVTDYDSWHPRHGEIDIEALLEVLFSNSAKARDLLSQIPAKIEQRKTSCPDGCDSVLDTGIMTHPDRRSQDMISKLTTVAGRVLDC